MNGERKFEIQIFEVLQLLVIRFKICNGSEWLGIGRGQNQGSGKVRHRNTHS